MTIAEKLTELSMDIHELCRRFEVAEGVTVVGVIERNDARIWIIPSNTTDNDNCFIEIDV